MCVAIFKEDGKPVPTLETLKMCWDTNPDGAGFGYWDKDKGMCLYRKGYMHWKDFESAYKVFKLGEMSDRKMFFHFRIGTHGNKDGGNTHPFPVLQSFEKMRELKGYCKTLFMHNGVLPFHARDTIASDTMEMAFRIAEAGFNERMPGIFKGLIGGNKFAFMYDNRVSLVGDWIEKDGVWFSNTLWEQPKYPLYSRNWNSYKRNEKEWDYVPDDKKLHDKFNQEYENGYASENPTSEEERRMYYRNECPACGSELFDTGKGKDCDFCGIHWNKPVFRFEKLGFGEED